MNPSIFIRLLFSIFCLLVTSLPLLAQPADTSARRGYPPINENMLLNTKWKYTFTSHTESNTVIHRAENGYDYFLNLKYDGTLEHYLNGRYHKDVWKLNEAQNELYYNHRQIDWWRIAEFTEQSLVLEFSLNARAAYRYHFVSVTDEEAPFVRPADEFAPVIVNAYATQDTLKRKEREPTKRQLARAERRAKRNARSFENAAPPVFIKIELVGGGYYGGPDPVYSDYTVINTDGRILRETKTELRGTIKSKREISRKMLEELMAFIEAQGFFSFEMHYGCTSPVCEKRTNMEPPPIPLRLVVSQGARRKVVTVAIFGKDERNVQYVDYPPGLQKIVEAIQKL